MQSRHRAGVYELSEPHPISGIRKVIPIEPRRHDAGARPKHMEKRKLASGAIAFYWRAPPYGRRHRYPITCRALGKDFAIAKTQAELLNCAFNAWRLERKALNRGRTSEEMLLETPQVRRGAPIVVGSGFPTSNRDTASWREFEGAAWHTKETELTTPRTEFDPDGVGKHDPKRATKPCALTEVDAVDHNGNADQPPVRGIDEKVEARVRDADMRLDPREIPCEGLPALACVDDYRSAVVASTRAVLYELPQMDDRRGPGLPQRERRERVSRRAGQTPIPSNADALPAGPRTYLCNTADDLCRDRDMIADSGTPAAAALEMKPLRSEWPRKVWARLRASWFGEP